MPDPPIAFEAYEELAHAYAAAIDTKPHNAYYERPATLSLLPDLTGKRVLDAGCGPGVYSEWMLDRGAEVVAIDASPRMVALARERTQGRAAIHVADLNLPLTLLEENSFDVVVCPLVLEYVREWRVPLSEFNRVLARSGQPVVSVSHPMFDFTYFRSKSYFETELVSAVWGGFGRRVRMPSYRRSLEDTLNPFGEAGFVITRVTEPRPTEEFKAADPKHYAELSNQPCFLCIQAVKR